MRCNMGVRQHLQVSAEAFFAEIMTSICADIQKATKKKVRMAILEKGYSYTKRLPKRSTKNAKVIVKVLDCIPNRHYCASFTSQMDITIVSYDIEVMDAGTIAVTYEENMQNNGGTDSPQPADGTQNADNPQPSFPITSPIGPFRFTSYMASPSISAQTNQSPLPFSSSIVFARLVTLATGSQFHFFLIFFKAPPPFLKVFSMIYIINSL